MNQEAQAYWNEYWGEQDQPENVSAWQFGADPDYLAQLVIDGIKTATCSAHLFYELENEPLPTTEDYSIVLNSEDKPVALIKTVEVTLTPMNEVSAEFAAAEGEGDKSYQYWWKAHETFFRNELNAIGREFSEDMLLVCERFEVIDVK
ncbi:ASCH domain-containing protein [Gracilibacillus salinarum]|uniref:ASCH domain-containing protein n=1 Tax=Gracilibacillus salinarum TaxID=2932255 RepID=A0ABY4GTD3_9BACI|nr:ASCH domain-containing protein [Gracilibacillus salinarum]UOQ87544.1 ASCH domain-containing protein [Gracilibacillus salinarum]